MSIIQTVNFHTFQESFKSRKYSFSYAGLNILYEMLEQLSESIGEDIELDPISLCGEYTENTLKEFIYNYAGSQNQFEESELEYITSDYLPAYLEDNLYNLLNDQDIVKTYFSFLLNDTYYYLKDNKVFITPDFRVNDHYEIGDLIGDMVEFIVESMDYREFLKLICDIENDTDYLESIDSIMYDIVTEYLDNEGGLYMISDCRTIVVYQDF